MGCVDLLPSFAQPALMLGKAIGENIKAARKAKGWSLEALAAAVEPKSSYQQISRLETAERPITAEWIERIARALEVDPLTLVVPDLERRSPSQALRLDEQVATEAARTLAAAALGDEPDWGTVQSVSLVLRELLVLFSAHPEAAADVRIARPAITLAGSRLAHEGR